jgi:hypothetical protein
LETPKSPFSGPHTSPGYILPITPQKSILQPVPFFPSYTSPISLCLCLWSQQALPFLLQITLRK